MTLRPIRWLLKPQPPWWRQTLLYLPVALVPSALLVTTAYVALLVFGIDPQPFSRKASPLSTADVVGSVVFAPLAETALLAGLLRLLLLTSQRLAFIAAVSALLFGALHATLGVLAFFGATWGFFVLSCAYLAWRRVSFAKAFAAALVPHMLSNAIVFAFLSSA